ncbi:GldL-related protein [Adhaeribacter radiodurans]|nr:hypothetical protein [Adhaeribacter radiodurans]
MKLTKDQILFIEQDIRERGITMEKLADSLLDHICCSIESGPESDFATAYAHSLTSFGKEGIQKIQQEIKLQLLFKKEIMMKKMMYVFGYIAASLVTTGLLFKLNHWPGATILLVLGIALLNLGFLPLYFYERYKMATS